MSDEEIRLLKNKLSLYSIIWMKDSNTFIRVSHIGFPQLPDNEEPEHSECAILVDGTYCALDNSEISDFKIIKDLT